MKGGVSRAFSRVLGLIRSPGLRPPRDSMSIFDPEEQGRRKYHARSGEFYGEDRDFYRKRARRRIARASKQRNRRA